MLCKGRFLGLTFLLLTALAYKGELEPQSAKQNVRSNSQFLYERVQSSRFLHFVLYVHSLAEEFSALIQTIPKSIDGLGKRIHISSAVI